MVVGGRHGKTGRSVSRIGVGSLEQQTDCREAENPSDLRHFSTHFFFSTRGGSGDGGKGSSMQSWEVVTYPEPGAAGSRR